MASSAWKALTGDPRRKALFAAAAALTFLAGAWWSGHHWHRQKLLAEARGEALAQLDPNGDLLTIDLARHFEILRELKVFIETHRAPGTFGADFEKWARERVADSSAVRAAAIAPAGAQQFIYPSARNADAVEDDFLRDSRPEVLADVGRAMASRGVVVSGPYESRGEGLILAGRLAVYRSNEFWGLVTLLLDVLPILEETGVTKKDKLKIALRTDKGRVFFGEPMVFQSDPVVHRIELPEGHWELAAIPGAGWSGAISRELGILDAGALSAVTLLSVLVYLSTLRGARLTTAVENRTREIDTARQNLEAELTERKEVEKRLQVAEERYRHMVDFSPDAVLVNYQGRIVYVNAAALRLFGVSRREELLGRSPLDFIPVSMRPEIETRNKMTLESGLPTLLGAQTRTRPDGSIFHVETAAAPVAWEGGVATQVILRDVTELRKAETWVRTLIEAVQDALISIDDRGRIVLFNPAAERMFGYSRSEIVGHKVNILMAEPHASEHDGYIERYRETGVARAIGRVRLLLAKRKNGEIFPIEISVSEMRGEKDIPYAALIRDVSEKERMQAQLIESERLATIGATAAKIGHELANPVNGMSLTIRLLEQRLATESDDATDQTYTTIRRLKEEISRLNELTRQFREFVRKEKYVFQTTQLRGLIDDVIKLQEPHFRERDIDVELVSVPDLPPARVDVDKIKQVLLNLLKNAVEAMPDGGKITIEARAVQQNLILEITDTGVGISPDVDAFEPFVTTKKEGTGIGLVVVRQIVTAHGGTISYRSEAGRGTTFRIELPRS